MSNNAPVPEWFGGAQPDSAKSSRAQGLGCSLLLLFALVAAVAIYFAVKSRARAQRLERDLAAARQQAKAAQSAMQRSATQAEKPPKPVPAAPARDAAPPDAATPDAAPPDAATVARHKLDARALQQVLRPLRPEFRKCYEAALAKDPNAEGRLRLEVRIAPSGRVSSVKTSMHSGLPPAVGRCVSARLRAARFPASGQSTTMSLPLTFEPN